MSQFTTRSGYVLGTCRTWPFHRHFAPQDSFVDYIFTHDVLYNKESALVFSVGLFVIITGAFVWTVSACPHCPPLRGPS